MRTYTNVPQSQQVYLDTAATSLTPTSVLQAMGEYYRGYRASTHRGLYKSALRATEAYEHARHTVAELVGSNSKEIVFTSGATASSNTLTYAFEQSLELHEGDEIVTTVMEHHSSLIPLQELAQRKRLTLKHIPLDGLALDYQNAEELITDNTKIVSVMFASNVLGTVNDVARITRRAHEVGAVMIVDGTAAVGHMPVSVRDLECDFLYFSGHKMCGPTGVGVLYGKKKWLERLSPSMFGGGIVESVTLENATYTTAPHKFEPGTPNIAGVIGLGAAVDYLSEIGLVEVQKHCQELTAYAQQKLSSIEGLTLYSARPENNVGIVSFTLEGLPHSEAVQGVHPHDIAQVCADNNVAIRAGHHCAQPLQTELGIPSTARASFYMYNTKEDVDALVEAVQKARSLFL
jgi:cysteine desulfurase/selenocysteine lyase